MSDLVEVYAKPQQRHGLRRLMALHRKRGGQPVAQSPAADEIRRLIPRMAACCSISTRSAMVMRGFGPFTRRSSGAFLGRAMPSGSFFTSKRMSFGWGWQTN
jgi:hypothetical protein